VNLDRSPLRGDDHRDRSWMADGACRGLDADTVNRLFFSERGQNDDITEAKAVCAACPVRAACLEYGMAEMFGVWGGRSARERRQMRPAWRRAQQREAS